MPKLSVKEYLAKGGSSVDSSNNFWDWFCSNSALNKRGNDLDKKVKILSELGIIDEENHSVSYKNNCPLYGKLYDSILVTNLNDKEIYWIIPKCGHESKSNIASIYIYSLDKEIEFKSWTEMKKIIKTEGLDSIKA